MAQGSCCATRTSTTSRRRGPWRIPPAWRGTRSPESTTELAASGDTLRTYAVAEVAPRLVAELRASNHSRTASACSVLVIANTAVMFQD
ncbi:hypothetical protein C2845_PM01G29440 [Panicum miliaceum]|uniref:Uncharacterized protein n=1 Tax=Panicum miliaceum TaxID=4540 RepID=A0A3L6TQJ1_PANMI|nr:hypothetical protein C2845_PM01G29440 [Panicum miliaceum]